MKNRCLIFTLGILLPFFWAPLSVFAAPPEAAGAVLVRGNMAVRGIPGFGINALNAIYGAYAITIAEQYSGEGQFFVWVCGENFYLPGPDWSTRPDLPALSVYQQNLQDSLILALPVGEGGAETGLVYRMVVFQFPAPVLDILGQEGVSRLVRAWVARFRYFFNLAESYNNLSLPALVEF
jgi:hypothetical protein